MRWLLSTGGEIEAECILSLAGFDAAIPSVVSIRHRSRCCWGFVSNY
jgi:hypothetical protein